ncbi:hypothetical protein [Hyalangium rubrum]|uniref:Uncharacterized protein n=1 Tax=Hyalangium rubrum TaxID=3103134 RepID=A0ABU5HB91_9BACT|nr:hypothetical protein [Hyalangium sp. s54d21]MDY7230732.1 hypothetical protein [Hyalangium sp. s54d21]
MNALASLGVLAQVAAGEVGSGRIQGGWGYVWVSYGIAWGSLALYSLSLWLRRPKTSPGMKES